MTFGARFSNGNTGYLTLTESSNTTVFRGKARLIKTEYALGLEDPQFQPPFGLQCTYEMYLAWPDPPLVFVSTPPSGYISVWSTYEVSPGRMEIIAVSTERGFVPDCYVFQRLNFGEAVRGNYGMVIYGPGGPSGMPVFSTNRQMCNPWATQVVGVPASNSVVPGHGISISTTTQGTPWSPGTQMPPKPAVMMFTKSGCTPPGAAVGYGMMIPGVRLEAGQAVVGWVGVGWDVPTFSSPHPAPPNQNIVCVINGASYD
jgi:hypothetical protein